MSEDVSHQAELKAQKDAKARLVVSLGDVHSLEHLEELVEQLRDLVAFFSIGSALCTQEGAPQVIRAIKQAGGEAFLNLNFHDSPEAVGKAVSQAAKWGASMISVHAASGLEALQSAVQNRGESQIFGAIPFLFPPQRSAEVYDKYPETVALRLADLAQKAQCNGIIGRPEILARVRHLTMLKVVTDIEQGMASDGRGLRTPLGALKAGASLLVINYAPSAPHVVGGDTLERFQAIRREIEETLLPQPRPKPKAPPLTSCLILPNRK